MVLQLIKDFLLIVATGVLCVLLVTSIMPILPAVAIFISWVLMGTGLITIIMRCVNG